MKVTNKDFWEFDEVIGTQDRSNPKSSDYEVYLYNKAAERFANRQTALRAKIFGCGTGREIPEVLKYTKCKTAVASDISANMIKKCRENLELWNISDKVETVVSDAAAYKAPDGSFDLTTIMNSMLTYVVEKKDRYQIFRNCFNLLADNGVILGVVHHQKGAPLKTLYFMLRRIFSPFLSKEVGFRNTGFKGYQVEGYYFSEKDLFNHLNENGFKNIEILSLAEYYKRKNFKYDRLKGYNNLIFFATKS
ncbi:MAG TPA: class I SAM-dependent methyltransferase [Flavobacterium sp.]|jgi:ubiquinone/menaquinone biosynthesis C-methylase UbiE